MEREMLIGIINNAILLLGLGVVYSVLPVAKTRNRIYKHIIIGIPLSLIAVFVMQSPFIITTGVVLDTRSILISVAAFFFGLIPTIMVIITASVVRIIEGGSGALTGVLVIVFSGLIGLLFRKYRYDKIINKKVFRLIEFYIVLVIVHIVMLFMFLFLPEGIRFDVILDIYPIVLLVYPVVGVAYAALIFLRFDNVSEKNQMIEELEYAANFDFLTGIWNRKYYEESLKILDRPENYPLSIVVADINGLKLINDAFGHHVGDELLKSAANIISVVSGAHSLVARTGGDEFVIVFTNSTKIQAEEKITQIKEECKSVKVNAIELSISFGCSTKTVENEDIYEIYRSAEDLMYREKLLEIPSMRSGAIETILSTLNEKDKHSEIHSRMVSNISMQIAKHFGMDRQDIAEVKTAGLLHDIGKIIIPLPIINKKGSLTADEYAIIKNHPEIGYRILNSTQDMRSISDIVLSHHERWDGLGYPRGIQKEDIPLKSRIISIADAFDAMTSERSYRKTMTKEEALQEIVNHSGTQFDPQLVQVFEEHFDEITSSNLADSLQ